MTWTPPKRCIKGHPLVYPNVKVSWVQCGCETALGRPKGHGYAMCLTCSREVREDGCDQLVDGYPVKVPPGSD